MTQPVLRLSAGDPADPDRMEGRIAIAVAGEPLEMELSVPQGPVSMETMLPVVHGITNALVDRGVAAVERAGKAVSCRAGCGACCRQIVPIAESEARAIARLVETLPEPRRSEMKARFEDALRRMAEAGLLDLINKPDRAKEETIDLILRYLRVGIACPFLEDESCSIHPMRPVICREYLVTSPPANCTTLEPGTIARVPLSGNVALALLTAARGTAETTAWIPLVASLRLVAGRPEQPPTRTAPDHLKAIFADLTA